MIVVGGIVHKMFSLTPQIVFKFLSLSFTDSSQMMTATYRRARIGIQKQTFLQIYPMKLPSNTKNQILNKKHFSKNILLPKPSKSNPKPYENYAKMNPKTVFSNPKP
tara:strand:- start:150 stop:470 length:321 start_codon:yes stop_codon:yes gene_type:complete